MDLRDGKITIAEILAYPPAKALLVREFPRLANHPMLHRAGKITLNTAIALAGDALPEAQRRQIIARLQGI